MTATVQADTIFYNGDVVTVEGDPSTWEAKAVAVKDGNILYVGTKQEALRYQGTTTTLVDLEGDTLVPGFIEPHTHPDTSAFVYNLDVDVSGLLTDPPPTKDEAWQQIKDAVAKCPPGGWVVVWGFNGMLIPGMSLPTLAEIDEIAPDIGLALVLQGSHVMMVNSNALKMAGVDDTTEVIGGEFLKDENGKLNGMCYEVGAMARVMALFPQMTYEVAKEYMKEALNMYGRNGFTTVAILGLGTMLPDIFNLTRDLATSDCSAVRVVAYLDENLMNVEDKAAGHLIAPNEPSAARFSHMGVKFWADGSPYSGSIAVQQPFLESQITQELGFRPYPNYGFLTYDYAELYNLMNRFHQRDFHLCCHAHGERAIDQVLDVYETMLNNYPRENHRYRLEHCILIRKDQLQRAKDMGVYVSFYPDHIWFYGSFLRDDILGPDRGRRIMPFKSALEAGHEPTAHSDTPCTTLGIMRVIKTVATRAVRQPNPEAKEEILGPEECVSVDEALKTVTINAAKQILHENFIGSIARGKVADFTRLSDNPRKVPAMDIDKIAIKTTYRGGREAKYFDTYGIPRGVMNRSLTNLQQLFKK